MRQKMKKWMLLVLMSFFLASYTYAVECPASITSANCGCEANGVSRSDYSVGADMTCTSSAAIVVSGSGIGLNGNSRIIIGSGSGAYDGVYVTSAGSGATIQNFGDITGFQNSGVFVSSASGVIINNVRATGNRDGIVSESAAALTIQNSFFNFNTEDGMDLIAFVNGDIDNVEANSNSDNGLVLGGSSSGASVTSNVFCFNGNFDIIVGSGAPVLNFNQFDTITGSNDPNKTPCSTGELPEFPSSLVVVIVMVVIIFAIWVSKKRL
jgi:hypothetical protein